MTTSSFLTEWMTGALPQLVAETLLVLGTFTGLAMVLGYAMMAIREG